MAGAGAGLLCLPVSTRGPGGEDPVTALFASTSALCVTGLTVHDTASHFTATGQVVLLVEMQLGGIGIMMFSSALGLLVAGRLRLRSRVPDQIETGFLDGGTLRRLVGGILRISLLVEAATWTALTLCLWLGHGTGFARATYLGLFHSVSAFTNSGFTLWPDGMSGYRTDPLLLGPVLVAFTIGGIGYPVLLELGSGRRPGHWSLHTKITLVVSGVLMLIGPLVILCTEWSNPATIGGLPTGHRLLAGAFAGIAPRSSGFNVFDYSQAEDATLMSTTALMFVGGGSSGTAGGIKVTTLAVLLLAVISELRGEADVNAFGRRIAPTTLRQAVTVIALHLAAIGAGALFLSLNSDVRFIFVLFDVTSATSTGGLSTGIAPDVPAAGHLMLVVLMFAGRIGTALAVFMPALRRGNPAYRNPRARPIIG